MSSEWYGWFDDEKLSHRVVKCIADLFYEPFVYDELCFYCIEGASCPYHEIPQERIQVQQKDNISMDYVLDEIFGLQSDCCKCTNCEVEVVTNYRENRTVKVPQNCTAIKQSINIQWHVIFIVFFCFLI
ncbi:hypothetical protein LOAG_06792 [Loa loa]|uniref:Uncharacterized protein n=1 Tax=Loa loa TaxID=7209 RepID=A0A1S0TWZ2_LOALO|nr:hypothetical protein LOAG_06792 [Loa loa]EFO21694.1 hypothetical protein LOAG_06792 [Loa loa]